ncbi:MAG: hypothetical protein HDQ87_00245 [Clostridia bacterium]|nr:hypothetical protein [Clostridia bacterium]
MLVYVDQIDRDTEGLLAGTHGEPDLQWQLHTDQQRGHARAVSAGSAFERKQ